MEAIILAGGFGTRLSHIVSDVPKPMAPINNKPFLVYILDYLYEYNFKRVILAVGYKSDIIKTYFGNSYKNMEIIYSDEDTPLGTGGAIKKALVMSRENNTFILNGDTFFDVDLTEMKVAHESSSCDVTVAVKTMNNFNRYGSVLIKENKIVEFIEKKKMKEGIINGGVYLLNKGFMDTIQEKCFSFEQLILESLKYEIYAYKSDGYFIDIGVPEDYYKAKKDFISK